MICPTHDKYHDFNVPVESAPHSRQCACGQPQRYKPPIGRGREFADELIPRSLLAPIFRLAAGGYEGTHQQRLDSEDVIGWVLPLLD